MYLRLKFEPEISTIISRKTMLYVGVIHVVFVLFLYLLGIVQNSFWKAAPQSIVVSLTSSAEFRVMGSATAELAAAKQVKTQRQRNKTEKIRRKETKRVQKNPAQKTWKPLDETQITKTTETRVKEFNTMTQTASVGSLQDVSASILAANLKKSLSSVKFESGGVASQANPAVLAYYNSISSFLYERWEQPSRFAALEEPPSVLVRLNIGTDGRLIDYNIIKDSKFTEMNNSVKRMLDAVTRLPNPPGGAMVIEATLILTN